jgi:hypothetical protein
VNFRAFAKDIKDRNPTLTDCYLRPVRLKGMHQYEVVNPLWVVVGTFDSSVGVGKKRSENLLVPILDELDFTLFDYEIYCYRDEDEFKKWLKSR